MPPMSADIILATINARYIHASLGLRYLRANLGAFRERSEILEFTIKRPVAEMVTEILKRRPRVVGLGVYIWNVDATVELVRELRKHDPNVVIVAGGPEISYESETQALFPLVDYIFRNEAEFSFRAFIEDFFNDVRPPTKVISSGLPEITTLKMPYGEYTADDIAHRTLYVEASRGCPYKCEYCLSSLDVSVRNFPVESFLAEIKSLLDRGARNLKFVDRTFNLSLAVSGRILKFFLDYGRADLFLHFEMVPDRLPEDLKDLIRKFPKGSLQFEIGIQTLSPSVARHVSRKQDLVKTAENFRFLREQTGVHTHADLIVGLPGETWESFADGFNTLYGWAPDEIQVGTLKRLKGTPIVRHDAEFAMVYDSAPPFQILSTRDLTMAQIRELNIFADFHDLIANSGRFKNVSQWVIGSAHSPFEFFLELSRAMFTRFGRTHSIHLRDLEQALTEYFKHAVSARLLTSRAASARQNLHALT
jgi:radical SAM superfamily enzyme YgiQ (UPF0313 family)